MLSRSDRSSIRGAPVAEQLYMTTQEVADLVRAPVETVRYWRHVGKGPDAFKVGRRVLYRRTTVEHWLAAHEGAGRVEPTTMREAG